MFWCVLNVILFLYMGLIQPIIEFIGVYQCTAPAPGNATSVVAFSLADPYATGSSAAALVFVVLAVVVLVVILMCGKKVDVHRIRSCFKLDVGLIALNIFVFVVTPFVLLICYGTLTTAVSGNVQGIAANATTVCAQLNCGGTSGVCYPGSSEAAWFLVAFGLALSIMLLVGNSLLFVKFVFEAKEWNYKTPNAKDVTVLGKAVPKDAKIESEHGTTQGI